MRPVLDGDLTLLARAAVLWPAELRVMRLERVFMQTHAADLYRKRFGRAHPRWGNGSVMARVLALPRGRAVAGAPDHLEALEDVCRALRHWHIRV